jgi:hypothetical protein
MHNDSLFYLRCTRRRNRENIALIVNVLISRRSLFNIKVKILFGVMFLNHILVIFLDWGNNNIEGPLATPQKSSSIY